MQFMAALRRGVLLKRSFSSCHFECRQLSTTSFLRSLFSFKRLPGSRLVLVHCFPFSITTGLPTQSELDCFPFIERASKLF